MVSKAAYENYRHRIRTAYHSLKLVPQVSDEALQLLSFDALSSLSQADLVNLVGRNIRERLFRLDPKLVEEFLDVPRHRVVYFNNRRVFWPLLNRQAVKWYGESDIYNFDFIEESFLGMHEGAKCIYDIGGHQGIWALYYAGLVGNNGRVYSFEPSIINIECAALLFLLNEVLNVISVPFGIGDETGVVERKNSAALVDFVDHNIGLIRLDQVFWEPADFIKIDIEGFEYELVRSFPEIFDFCPNIHLELHIPHLLKRGLDYKDVVRLIPFESVSVLNSQHGRVVPLGPDDELVGFCSLMIRRKSPYIS